jgi:hypothetical protein
MVGMSFVFGAMPGSARPTPGHPTRASLLGAAAGGSRDRLHQFAARPTPRSLAGALSYFAAMQLMIAHGVWLADQYGLDAAAELGLVAFVFGWFDLAASVSVSLFTDRIGKKRSVLIGIRRLAGRLHLLMPLLNVSLIPASADHRRGARLLRVQHRQPLSAAERAGAGTARAN